MNTSNSLKKVMRTTAVGALLAALLPMPSALAALPAMPSSGTCAMLVTQAAPYGSTVPFGPTGYNITAVLTFTSINGGTLEYYNTQVVYFASGIEVTAPSATTPATPINFTLAASGDLTGSYILHMVPLSGQPLEFNVTPANGGKTLLIQGRTQPFSGVCQF